MSSGPSPWASTHSAIPDAAHAMLIVVTLSIIGSGMGAYRLLAAGTLMIDLSVFTAEIIQGPPSPILT